MDAVANPEQHTSIERSFSKQLGVPAFNVASYTLDKAHIQSTGRTTSPNSVSDKLLQARCSAEARNMRHQPKASSFRSLLLRNNSAFRLSDPHELSMEHSKEHISSSSTSVQIKQQFVSEKKKANRMRSLSYVHITPEESEDLGSSRLAIYTKSKPMNYRLLESDQLIQPLALTDQRRATSQLSTKSCSDRQPYKTVMYCRQCQKMKIQDEIVDRQVASETANNYVLIGYEDQRSDERPRRHYNYSTSSSASSHDQCYNSRSTSSNISTSSRSCGGAGRGVRIVGARDQNQHRGTFISFVTKALNMSCKFS